jgi:EmrB/QacA subfamily drug resistance transporter
VSAADDRLDRATRWVAATVVIGSVMQGIDSTVVNIATATLARDLHASVSQVQWVISSYLLSLSMVILLTGWAVDRFGAQRVFMTSVAAFVVSSALCASAWSVGSLIAFRVFQGLAGGMTAPVGHTLLVRAAGPGRVGRIMGVLGVATTLAPVAGPVVGGIILDAASWRWLFLINLPIGLATLALGARHLRPDQPNLQPVPLDVRGFALLAPGVVLVVYGLSAASAGGSLHGARSLGSLAAGLVLSAVFVRHARRLGPRALVQLRLFRHRAFRGAAGVTSLLGFNIYGANFLLPLLLQVGRGRSALESGLLLIAQSIGATVANWPCGRLTDRFGAGRVVPWGLLALFAGTVVFALSGPNTPLVVLAAALAVRGVGIGASVVPAMAGTYATLAPEDIPQASSTILLIQRLGGSVGTAVVATLLQRQLGGAHLRTSSSLGDLSRLPAAVLHELSARVVHVFALPYAVVAASALLAVIPSLLLPRARRGVTTGR